MPSNISKEYESEEVDLKNRRSKRIVANGSYTLYCDNEDDFTEEKLHSKRKRKSKQNVKEGGQSSIVSFFQMKPCNEQDLKLPEDKSKNFKEEGPNDKLKKKVKLPKEAKPIDSKLINDDHNLEVQGEITDNKKVRFSNDIVEYSPEVVKVNSSDSYKEKLNENNFNEEQVSVKNAFTFMMDSRHKVIGQNLSGKELERDELSRDKTDLLVRKSLLQEWADTKGAKKRRCEYEETGAIIDRKLKKRAKRLKQMLTQEHKDNEDKSKTFAKHQKLHVIQSDSDSEIGTAKQVSTFQENEASVGILIENVNLNTTTFEAKDLNLDSTNPKKFKLNLKKKNQNISNDAEKNQKSPGDLDEKSNSNLSCVTPNTTKKWKMRIKVPLSDEEEVSKSNEAVELLEDSKKVVESKIKAKVNKISNWDCDSNKDCASKKVASIFVKAKRMSTEAKEARKKFLRSGIPCALKKRFESEKVEELEVQLFPTISHVMVKPTEEEINNSRVNYWNLPLVDLNYSNVQFVMPDLPTLKFGSITYSSLPDNTSSDLENYKISNVKTYLYKIKAEHPNYPVYKVFNSFHQIHVNERQKVMGIQEPESAKRKRGKKKAMKEQKEMPKVHFSQMWTELYKPSKSDDIFGNRSSVSYVKKWLQKWLESVEMEFDTKLKNRRNSDSSSDFEYDEREDSRRLLNNTLILSGPHGSGKTSVVYTICNELAINVLEINASSKRTGKQLLNDLQEATQSQQVRKADKGALNLFLNRDSTKSSLQSSSSLSPMPSQRMCVLLIEDVDVVFDQDENFISSLVELINTSKRPLVLTLTDKNCLHLKRFLSNHKIVTFKLLEPKILSTWLQVLCLKENLWANNRALSELLENNGGDIRRTLLQLQFWVQTGGHSKIFQPFLKSTVDSLEGVDVVADESSNMSWLNGEGNISKEDVTKECTAISSYKSLLTYPLDLGKIWWNLPGMLGLQSPLPRTKEDVGENQTDLKKLEDIANVLDTMAFTDVWYTGSKIDSDLEPVCGSKCAKTKDSLSLNESFLNYMAGKDFCYELSHTLLSSYIQIANNPNSGPRSSISDIKCWYQKQKKSSKVFYEITPPDCCLNHHAIKVDYFSALRQMARSEHIRFLGNIKRNNRFYHYLRNLGMSYKSCDLEVTCKVLNCGEL